MSYASEIMIFHLEINGELKQALVHEPYSSQLQAWNHARSMVLRGGSAWYYATAQLKSIASAAVAAGAYQEKH